MSSNADIQPYKNILVEYADQSNDVKLKVGCNGPTDKGIVLDYDLGSVVKSFKINSGGLNWTDGINTFNTNLDKLCALEIKLPALQIAPNPTTLKLNDTILLDNGTADTLTLNTTSITVPNSITLTSSLLGDINLDAPNIDSFNYAMPICFTKQRTDNFSYSVGGQTFDKILQRDFAIPQQFVSISPMVIGLTSTIWKIEFAFNMFQVSSMTDKGMGIFIDFIDAGSNVYTPIIYNANTPFSIDRKDNGYGSGVDAPYLPINWTDYVDLGGLYNTGSNPIDMRIYFAADGSISSSYNMLLTLTRTNLV
jgi:hypothetical protein